MPLDALSTTYSIRRTKTRTFLQGWATSRHVSLLLAPGAVTQDERLARLASGTCDITRVFGLALALCHQLSRRTVC